VDIAEGFLVDVCGIEWHGLSSNADGSFTVHVANSGWGMFAIDTIRKKGGEVDDYKLTSSGVRCWVRFRLPKTEVLK
jgi:hypothetical protein